MSEQFDVAVVGGGIVGLATARAIVTERPGTRVVLFEKEAAVATHQTGRNSGVIHAGVYYKPGSEKARLCGEGRRSMVEFCEEHGIAHEVCGKLVVATDPSELPRLHDLAERCKANNVPVELVGPQRIRELEPHAAGIEALYVSVTGIADYVGVCNVLAKQLTAAGVEMQFNTKVTAMVERSDHLLLEAGDTNVRVGRIVNCAGLHSDRVARSLTTDGSMDDVQIVPFRGEYFELAANRSHLVNNLIYPVPDPQFPFLGVHLTRGINGRIHAGPNAVLGLAREGYSWRNINPADIAEYLRFPGFRKLAAKQWRYGASEMYRSLNHKVFAKALQRLVPEVRESDLEPAPAGVRAQAVMADGALADDFLFRQKGRVLNVLNAPSPAATASLQIGSAIAKRLYT
jgi:(S)-2-hydroxyglutarate dehydrogenase